MPKVISKVQHAENLALCVWCGEMATIEQVLLWCSETKCLHALINSMVKCPFSDTDWIFGHCKTAINPLILTSCVCFRMEITKTLVILVGLQRFTAEQATDASWRFLPDRSFDSHPTMIAALACTFDTTPQELC